MPPVVCGNCEGLEPGKEANWHERLDQSLDEMSFKAVPANACASACRTYNLMEGTLYDVYVGIKQVGTELTAPKPRVQASTLNPKQRLGPRFQP